MTTKTKAFTLTELLVVIVIAGILAAVALPKFNAVVETRRTGEAEELSAAIRNEQEKRCALDQSYTVNASRVGVAGTSSTSANFGKGSFNYTLNSEGLIATRTDTSKDYRLVMPSYKDGRMYCEGYYCEKLNKNYPTKDELLGKPDYRAATDCAAMDVEEAPTHRGCTGEKEETKRACTAPGTCGYEEREWHCNNETGEWVYHNWDQSNCVSEPSVKAEACNGCGTAQVTYSCTAGAWKKIVGECSKTQEECEDCCDPDYKGDFAECIAKQYGYDSAEYICASAKNGYDPEVGSVSALDLCMVALGLGSGASANKGRPASWLSGGFKRYACDGAPCPGQKPDDYVTSCNKCGERLNLYTCLKGDWHVTDVTECSKTKEECMTGCKVGDTNDDKTENQCGYITQHQECKLDWTGYEGYWANVGSPTYALKTDQDPNIECMYTGGVNGNTYPEKTGYYCDVSTCKYVKKGSGGGGGSGSGGGGGGGCGSYTFTDMYSGSFCNISYCGSSINGVRCY